MSLPNPFAIAAAVESLSPLSASAEFITSLTPSARMAIPFINQGVSAGLSANAILSALSDAGIGVARGLGLSLVRMSRASFNSGRLQQSLQGNLLPDIPDFTAAEYFTEKRYTYTIKHQVLYEDTGVVGEEFMSISSDTLLTNNQLADTVDNIMLTSAADYNFTILTSTVDSVLVDPRYLP